MTKYCAQIHKLNRYTIIENPLEYTEKALKRFGIENIEIIDDSMLLITTNRWDKFVVEISLANSIDYQVLQKRVERHLMKLFSIDMKKSVNMDKESRATWENRCIQKYLGLMQNIRPFTKTWKGNKYMVRLVNKLGISKKYSYVAHGKQIYYYEG